jgi:hypothetical protein
LSSLSRQWPLLYFASLPTSVPVGGIVWLPGTTTRPVLSWIACPGVVAYQRHSGFFTCSVISFGLDQVTPSSSLYRTHTRRPSAGFTLPRRMASSVAVAAERTWTSRTRPVSRTTGAGLPARSVPLSAATVCGPQVRPPSVERRRTMSMWPWSLAESTRPSQNARRVPAAVATTAGMR